MEVFGTRMIMGDLRHDGTLARDSERLNMSVRTSDTARLDYYISLLSAGEIFENA